MTENAPTPAELIAKARKLDGWPDYPPIIGTLADALETVTAERDALAARLESIREGIHAAREHASYGKSSIDGDLLAEGIEEFLSELPAAALAARDAGVRAEAADVVRTYWDTNGDLIDTNNGARLAFEAVAADIEEDYR